MIEKLFTQSRAPFITVRDGRLHIGESAYSELTVQIQEVSPVRKLFAARRLKCYSLDARVGKDGQFCELCGERGACSRRVQLRLNCRIGEQDQPAILEVPTFSFRAFDRLLEDIGGIEKLPDTLVEISPVRSENGWTNLQFRALF